MRLAVASAVALVCASALGSTWSYRSVLDSISRQHTHLATLVSDNSFQSSAPVAGTYRLRILLRLRSDDRLDVMLNIDAGKFVCDDCNIRVRFDDADAEDFSTYPANDRTFRTVVLGDVQRFVERAASAKRIRVEFVAYQNGNAVADFQMKESLKPLPGPVGVPPSTGDKQARLEAQEDKCRAQKDAFLQCLLALRDCYQVATKPGHEAVCNDFIDRFPAHGQP